MLIADRRIEPVTAKMAVSPTRVVTDDDLRSITRRYYDLTVQPFERLNRLANVNGLAADELTRLESELELDGADILAVLNDRHGTHDGAVLKPLDEARQVVAEQGFIAPEGSEHLGALVGAIRDGLKRGYGRIAALTSGEAIPSAPAPKTKQDTTNLTIRDAVYRYLDARELAAKAISETKLSLRLFEGVVDNKLLAAITRDDILLFVEHLSKQTVGGKTNGSLVRPLEPDDATLKAVLGKKHDVVGNQYTDEQLELFDAYHRRFKLGSKPAWHIRAMASLDDAELAADMPNVMTRLFDYVETTLAGLPE